MKSIFYFIILFIFISCQRNINLRITETTETATVVKGNRFEGVIFNKKPIAGYFNDVIPLSLSEIERVENLLSKQLSVLNYPKINQVNRCPKIDKKHHKYYRQYISYLDKNGDKIIHINMIYQPWIFEFIENNEHINTWISVTGGCSHFWNIKVNLTKEDVFDLQINDD